MTAKSRTEASASSTAEAFRFLYKKCHPVDGNMVGVGDVVCATTPPHLFDF